MTTLAEQTQQQTDVVYNIEHVTLRFGGVVSLNCQGSGLTPASTRHALSHDADAWSGVTGAAERRRRWSRRRGGR